VLRRGKRWGARRRTTEKSDGIKSRVYMDKMMCLMIHPLSTYTIRQ
jgi:hypothetical protein